MKHKDNDTVLTAHTRRNFLALMAGGLGISLIPNEVFADSIHPEPREDIDASLMISDEDIAHMGEEVQGIYNMVREIPHVADGIGCYCGCHTREGYRSLLTCYYPKGRAMGCPICQGEAKLVYRRTKEGQTLDQIRRAIDARYG